VQTDLKTNTQDLCSLEKKKDFFADAITDLTRKAPHMDFFLSPRRENFQLVESDVTLMDV
jgi:hypothetical protein